MARHFRELIVWRKAMLRVEAVHPVTETLPQEERFGLSSPLCRAAVSVASSLAEGHERRSRAEYRRFMRMACGSVAEVDTRLERARRLHRPDPAALKHALAGSDEAGRLLRASERSLPASTIADRPADCDPA